MPFPFETRSDRPLKIAGPLGASRPRTSGIVPGLFYCPSITFASLCCDLAFCLPFTWIDKQGLGQGHCRSGLRTRRSRWRERGSLRWCRLWQGRFIPRRRIDDDILRTIGDGGVIDAVRIVIRRAANPYGAVRGRQDPKTDPNRRPHDDKLRSLRAMPHAGSDKEMPTPKGEIYVSGRQCWHDVAPCWVVVIMPMAAIQFPMRRTIAVPLMLPLS
jgi:hypothetical protein